MATVAPEPVEQVVRIDSLVKGFVGRRDVSAEGRVYRISPHGWVAIVADGRQFILYPGRFLVRGLPRPEKARTDVPPHLR